MMKHAVAVIALVTVAACAQTMRQTPSAAPDNASPSATTVRPPSAASARTGNATAAAPAAVNTSPDAPAAKPLLTKSADGTTIAYEVVGSGPPLMLVHGGGQTRRSWQQAGYVERLAKQFTVITLDLRGFGDSGRPSTAGAYALEHVLADLLAVADAAKAPRFHLWAFGHGATIARYLPARSDRVISAALVGMTMGDAVTGVFKDALTGMYARWQPVIDQEAAGTLNLSTLSPGDRTAWEGGIAVTVLSLSAQLQYPSLDPKELKAPTLWVIGSEDSAMENVKAYEGKLAGTPVTVKVVSSVNYSDSFIKAEQMLKEVEPFFLKPAPAVASMADWNPPGRRTANFLMF